jgi:hypothetical protein
MQRALAPRKKPPPGEQSVSAVRVLVGTRKGAFVLTADGTRKQWEVSGPYAMAGGQFAPERRNSNYCFI